MTRRVMLPRVVRLGEQSGGTLHAALGASEARDCGLQLESVPRMCIRGVGEQGGRTRQVSIGGGQTLECRLQLHAQLKRLTLVDVCARERDGIAPFVREVIVGAGGRQGYAVGGALHSFLKFRDTALEDGDVLVRIRELPARLRIVVPRKHQRGVQFRVRRCRLIAQGSGQEKLPRVLRG